MSSKSKKPVPPKKKVLPKPSKVRAKVIEDEDVIGEEIEEDVEAVEIVPQRKRRGEITGDGKSDSASLIGQHGSSKADQIRFITSSFMECVRTKPPGIFFTMNDDNVHLWYVLITDYIGTDDEFTFQDAKGRTKCGQYLVRMMLDKNDPVRMPPRFDFLTPNGVFTRGSVPCISTGVYHSDQYKSGRGLMGFVEDMLTVLAVHEFNGIKGIAITKHMDLPTMHKMAAQSEQYNITHHADLMGDFFELYAEELSRTKGVSANGTLKYIDVDINGKPCNALVVDTSHTTICFKRTTKQVDDEEKTEEKVKEKAKLKVEINDDVEVKASKKRVPRPKKTEDDYLNDL